MRDQAVTEAYGAASRLARSSCVLTTPERENGVMTIHLPFLQDSVSDHRRFRSGQAEAHRIRSVDPTLGPSPRNRR